jgi:tetratricopeptide (TPR) repeat protein
MNRFASWLAIAGAGGLVAAGIAAHAENSSTLSIGVREGVTRLAFNLGGATSASLQRNRDRLVVSFNRPADLDIARLRVDPPPLVQTASVISRPGQNLRLEIVLAEGAAPRGFAEDGRYVLDLAAPKTEPKAQSGEKKGQAVDPRPKSGVVPVGFSQTASAAQFTFTWAAPVRAAVFMRDEAAWIVFDADVKLDLGNAARRSRLYTDYRVVSGEGATALRIAARKGLQLSAAAEGAVWTIVLSERQTTAGAAVAARKEPGADGAGQLVAPFERDGVVRWIADPIVGDTIGVGMAEGPTLGVAATRATMQAALGQSAHGAFIEPRADGVMARFEEGVLIVRRGDGLIASYRAPGAANTAPTGAPSVAESLGSYGVLNTARWSEAGEAAPMDIIDNLTREAAEEGVAIGAPSTARMALARYLLANDLAPEAIGALRVAAVNQPQLDVDPEYRLMRAAANTMMGRVREAERDLAASTLAKDPAAALWRGYAAGLSGQWLDARRNLEAGRDALSSQTPRWRALFLAMLAEAALAQGDLGAAENAVSAAAGEAREPSLRTQIETISARIAAARGRKDEALKAFLAIAQGPHEASAVRAALESARLRLESGAAKPEDVVEELEALRWRWRGDALELETIHALGQAYVKMGRWREGLGVMRSGGLAFAEHPASRRVRIEMVEIFERLFLEGEADVLEPIQALGLFYEFKDLTPFGADGDRLIRRLAGRLTDVDLLEKAAELLQHQIDQRLEGLAQAEIALDLAGVYMSDGKPERALAALAQSRQPRLPPTLAGQRRIMEASALMTLGRFDHAVEIVEKDKSREADLLRADVAYKSKDWPKAAAALTALLPAPGTSPLSAEDRRVALRAAVALTLAGEEARLPGLYRAYGARMGEGEDADAFELLSASPSADAAPLREAARLIARTELMDRYMASVRQRLGVRGLPEPPTPPAAAAAADAAGPA